MPVLVIVSHSLWATLCTVSRLPQCCSVSGMNGNESSSPLTSSVARISSSLRTSTSSPTPRLSFPRAADAVICAVVLATVHTRPSQLIVEAGLALEALDLGQAHVTAAEELVCGQAVPQVGLVQLFDALPDGPPRSELGQDPLDLCEVDPVVPRVGARAASELHSAAGNNRLDHVGHLTYREVLVAEPDIEGLIVGSIAVGPEGSQERPADVLDMDQRAPWRSVALDQHFASRDGIADQVVDHDVDPQIPRDAVCRGVAEEDGAEAVGRQLRHVLLDEDLRLPIGGHGIERRLLREGGFAAAGPVEAARRREQEPLHARPTGRPGEADRGSVVDVVRELRVEVTERIVRKRRKVDDGFETLEMAGLDVAEIKPDAGDRLPAIPEAARLVKAGVEPHHLVTGLDQQRDHDRSDVALMAGDQDLHR